MIDGNKEEHTDEVETNAIGECLGIGNGICLGEAMRNHTSLVMCNGNIIMIFEAEDLIICENVGIYQNGNQGPSLSRNEAIHLQVYHHFLCTYLCHLNM